MTNRIGNDVAWVVDEVDARTEGHLITRCQTPAALIGVSMGSFNSESSFWLT